MAVCNVALMAVPAFASALPAVTFKSKAVSISGFPGTGNKLGAGAADQAEFTISGTEYLGSPPPLIGVNVYLPLGVQLHPNGFPTCDASTIENLGPSACPKGAAAGPVGKAIGFVTFGGERVEETAELLTFYGPGGGAYVLADGHTPVSLEILYNIFRCGGRVNPSVLCETLVRNGMKARIADVSGTVLAGSPADFEKLIAEETDKWAKVVKFSGAKAD